MRRRKWLERAKSLLIAVLALTVLALTVLALPAKTVTDTPWLAALVRPFASVMGISQGDLSPRADGGRRKRHRRGAAGCRLRAKPRRKNQLPV